MLVRASRVLSQRRVSPKKVRLPCRRYSLLPSSSYVPASNEVTIYVKGFLARGESATDFHDWFISHHKLRDSARLNWSPNVTGFRWQNGDLPIPAPLASSALLAYKLFRGKSSLLKLTPAGLLASAGVDVALYAGMLATEFYRAENSLETQSLILAEQLERLRAQHTTVRVVAHSLGCRLVHHALKRVPYEARPHDIHYLAPAFVEDEIGPSLDTMAHQSIAIYHNKNDYILSLLYSGVTGGSVAVGAHGVSGKYEKVKTLDTTPYFTWLVHTEYRNEFHRFAL